MSDPIITVEKLSKRYVIGHRRSKADGFRHVIEDAIRHPLQWLKNWKKTLADRREDFWALKEVSFEVKRGEVVGLVGRNGAGKSTLLKILSRITEPTSGRIELNGRVASLLEVGTGFHPELTGRENIFLNGAILGMSRKEIQSKFDEIVAFSEIEKFLDTPVKRYSSGMYVRLAFAVAAHLEPEILIVDEVLAVGDANFQKKCLGKMKDVSGHGRTVLFVSHNMTAVKTLCSRAVLLKNGSIEADSSAQIIVSKYQNEYAAGQYLAPTPKAGAPHISRLWFSDSLGVETDTFQRGEPLVINVLIANPKHQKLHIEFSFWDAGGFKLWNFTHKQHGAPAITDAPKASVRIKFFLPSLNLSEVYVHAGIRVMGDLSTHYVDNITEGLRFLISSTTNESYAYTDTLLTCPVEFQPSVDQRTSET